MDHSYKHPILRLHIHVFQKNNGTLWPSVHSRFFCINYFELRAISEYISVGSAGYLLIMTGKPKIEFSNQIVSLTLNLLLNWYLIPLMGINGAAVATAASISLVNILRLCKNYQELRIHPFSLRIIIRLQIGSIWAILPGEARMTRLINPIDPLKRSGATLCQKVFGISYPGVCDEGARTGRSEPRRGGCLA